MGKQATGRQKAIFESKETNKNQNNFETLFKILVTNTHDKGLISEMDKEHVKLISQWK